MLYRKHSRYSQFYCCELFFVMNKKTVKKSSRSKLIIKLDQIFSRFIRLSACDKDWYITCPLCWARVHRKQAQNMHFITRSVYKYRRDERNCEAGCMRCNVILHGNYIAYTRYMQRKYGELRVDEMIADKQIVKISTPQIQELIEHYTGLVKELTRSKGIEL